jgi:hypothetical protein
MRQENHQLAVAEVDYLLPGRAQPFDELFLQFKSTWKRKP